MTAKKIRCALPNKSWLICGTILATELKEPEPRSNHHHIIGDPARIGPFIKKGLAKKKKPKKLQPKNQKNWRTLRNRGLRSPKVRKEGIEGRSKTNVQKIPKNLPAPTSRRFWTYQYQSGNRIHQSQTKSNLPSSIPVATKKPAPHTNLNPSHRSIFQLHYHHYPLKIPTYFSLKT